MSNATLLTADRTTHAKIVAVALIASIAVSLIGIAVRAKPVASEPLIQPLISSRQPADTPSIRIAPTLIKHPLQSEPGNFSARTDMIEGSV